MTTVLEPTSTVATARTSKRRWWVWSVVAVLVASITSIGAVAVHRYDVRHGYNPLGRAGVSVTGVLTPKTMRVGSGAYLVVGPRGSHATTRYTLGNNGSHAVHIDGALLPASSPVHKFQWRPFEDNFLIPRQPFPLDLAPGDLVYIYVTVTQPRCGSRSYLSSVPLRWSAMGVTHIFDFDLRESGGGSIIEFCPRSGEIAHSRTTP